LPRRLLYRRHSLNGLARHFSLVIFERAEGEPELREDVAMKVADTAEPFMIRRSVECVEPLPDVVQLRVQRRPARRRSLDTIECRAYTRCSVGGVAEQCLLTTPQLFE